MHATHPRNACDPHADRQLSSVPLSSLAPLQLWQVLHADSVYTIVNSHFSNIMSGDASLRLARDAYSPSGPVPLRRRGHILLVDRGAGARAMTNKQAVVQALERVASDLADGGGGGGGGGGVHAASLPAGAASLVRQLRVLPWRPSANNMSADVELWRHAALVVAPHGAGLANMLFAAEGTPIIEVGR